MQAVKLEEEDLAILRLIGEVQRHMYERGFLQQAKADNVLKRLFKFLKDFEICPYLLNTKTVFMIYYFTCISIAREPDPVIVEAPLTSTVKLSQSSKRSMVLRQSALSTTQYQPTPLPDHPELSFNQYLAILFRISVIFFDMNYKGTAPVRNYKKLLNLLSRIELTSGYANFIGELRHSKGLKMQTSLTPPKPLLMQLYLNEQVFASQAELEHVRDIFL